MSQEEKLCWEEILRRDLETLSPNLIITCGELALQVVTGKRDASKYRGSVIPSRLIDCKTLCFWSPDAIGDPKTPWLKVFNTRPEWAPFTQWDCQKAARHAKTPDYLEPPLEMIMVRNAGDFQLLRDAFLSDEYINNSNSRMGCDIEASYSEMTCIGFAKEHTKAYVVDLVHMSEKDLPYALLLINEILTTGVPKSFQNGNFDILFMAYHYHIQVKNFYWDTMLAFHACWPNLPKGLGVLGSIFTETPYWKDDAKGDEDKQWEMPHHKVDWPVFFRYNAKDCVNLLTIWDGQLAMLQARGTWDTFRREMRLCKPLLTMEYYGCAMNHSVKDKIGERLEKEIDSWLIFLYCLCGEVETREEEYTELLAALELPKGERRDKKLMSFQFVNPKSSKQLPEFLYNEMKLPKRVKGGKIIADVKALTSLVPYNPILIKAIMIIRDLYKQRSFTNMTTSADGRVRTTFKPAGTQTGRLSSSKSITGSGGNLQQQPKWAREYYVADQE
jgi:DNA polymerase I-like protein with 3'-5' exonuclease and polymerase domains